MNKLDEVCENNQILWHDLKHYLTVVQGMLYTSGVEKRQNIWRNCYKINLKVTCIIIQTVRY